ncbi:HAUS augmin-like complex subunit 4 [Camponotus japonicus]
MQDTNEIEKAMKSFSLCEKNINEHRKANIVYHCVKEASLNHKDVLSKSTANKLRVLLLNHELDKYMHLPSSMKHMQDELMLLGIIDLPSSDLHPDEKLEIKCCIETMLREKIHNMMLRYEELGGDVKKALKSNECNVHSKFPEYYDIPAVEWKNKIEELILQCKSDSLKYIKLIDRWNKMKYEDMNQAYLEKAEHLLLQAQVAELQAKLTNLSCTIRMFKETPTTIVAFKMLNQLVEEKLKAIQDEIRQKEDLKKLYDNLRNTEYDKILENYSQLCNAIKKKKHILDKLK